MNEALKSRKSGEKFPKIRNPVRKAEKGCATPLKRMLRRKKRKPRRRLARRHPLGGWAWGDSRWQSRRGFSYIPLSEIISAIGAVKHSALAYATGQHGCGQEQCCSRNSYHPVLLRGHGKRGPVSKRSPAGDGGGGGIGRTWGGSGAFQAANEP